MRAARSAAVVAVVLLALGCGGDDNQELTVFAAASLTEAFSEIGDATFSFAGSSTLVAQIRQGAPADVIATADVRTMDLLVEAGLVADPIVFAANALAVVVAPGNPKGIRGLDDLARNGLLVVVVDPAVPAGAYTARVLERASVTVRPASYELDVKAAVTKVAIGEADATIAYATELHAAGDDVDGFILPSGQNVLVRYPIAALLDGDRRSAAAFLDAVTSERGQGVLERHGFLPVP